MTTLANRTEIVNFGRTYGVVVRSIDEYSKDSHLKGEFKSLKGAENRRQKFLDSMSK